MCLFYNFCTFCVFRKTISFETCRVYKHCRINTYKSASCWYVYVIDYDARYIPCQIYTWIFFKKKLEIKKDNKKCQIKILSLCELNTHE
jgi:hypothetical protein